MKIAISGGRLLESILDLLEKSGINLNIKDRNYKPDCNIPGFEFTVLKPRNIPRLVQDNFFDCGIAGLDMVEDEKADVHLVLDLKIMPVYIIAAVSKDFKKKDKIVVASEYETIAENYLRKKFNYTFIKSYGSTESFVPGIADMIIDHIQTGLTLRENKLKVMEIIMKSTTYLIANKKSIDKITVFKNLLLKGMKKIDFKDFPDEKKIMEMSGYDNTGH